VPAGPLPAHHPRHVPDHTFELDYNQQWNCTAPAS
jgi:hypothetical protein